MRVPKEIQQRIARAGGWNLYGWPNYRLVWGWARLQLVGGTPEDPWVDRDEEGYVIREVVGFRRVPKYWMEGLERWHVERWIPPETCAGTPTEWAELKEAEMGPYPSQGEYEHSFTLPRKYGCDLNGEAVSFMVRLVEKSREMVWADRQKAKAALEEELERERKKWRDFADDVTREALSAFNGPAVTVPALPGYENKDGLYLPN